MNNMQYQGGALSDLVANIPGAFNQINNWLMWTGELTAHGRYTKIPYQVDGSMMRASPTNPEHWSTMGAAFNTVNGLINKGATECGMGFVITRETGLICIDLDDPQKCANPDKAADVQAAILSAFVGTYREQSPSGTGWHIWFYGTLPDGRDSMTLKSKAGIEVYAHKRFMTMTGRCATWGANDVAQQNEQLNWLVALMTDINGGALPSPVADLTEDQDDTEALGRRMDLTDDQVAQTCAKNNSVWMQAVWGKLSQDRSQNAQVVIGDLDKVTGSIDQIRRMFNGSPLRTQLYGNSADTEMDRKFDFWIKKARADNKGILEKAERGRAAFAEYNERVAAEEVAKMQEEISARNQYVVEQMEIGKQLHDSRKTEVVAPEMGRTEDGGFTVPFRYGPRTISEHATSAPPGVLSQMVRDIQTTVTQRASLDFAIAAALGVFAGLCGHAYSFERVNGALYMLMLGKSGQGKEAPETARSAMERNLLTRRVPREMFAGLGGQSNITSAQGLHRELEKQKTYYMVVGEGTEWLRNVTSSKIGALTDVRRYVLDLYGKNGPGNSVNPSKVVNKDNVLNRVHSPAMTILLEGERTTYDEVLGDREYLSSGLAARFIHIEGPDVLIQKNRNFTREYSNSVLQWLFNALPLWHAKYNEQHTISEKLNSAEGSNEPVTPQQERDSFIAVHMTDECREHHYGFDDEADAFVNAQDATYSNVFNRLVPNVLRVAVLCAASCDPYRPVITKDIYLWAQEFVLRGLTRIKMKMENGDTGVGDIRVRAMIRKEVELWGTMTQAERYEKLARAFPRKATKKSNALEALSYTRALPMSIMSRRIGSNAARYVAAERVTDTINRLIQHMEQQGDVVTFPNFMKDGAVIFEGRMIALPMDED